MKVLFYFHLNINQSSIFEVNKVFIVIFMPQLMELAVILTKTIGA